MIKEAKLNRNGNKDVEEINIGHSHAIIREHVFNFVENFMLSSVGNLGKFNGTFCYRHK